MQFYEDVMTHGHPESYDDAILEAGNRRAKNGKKILFWGGTDEAGAKYEQERSTGKRDAEGNMIMKTVVKSANASIVVAGMENIFLAQQFEMRRGAGEKSQAEKQTEAVKSERFRAQCEGVVTSLGRLDAALSCA